MRPFRKKEFKKGDLIYFTTYEIEDFHVGRIINYTWCEPNNRHYYHVRDIKTKKIYHWLTGIWLSPFKYGKEFGMLKSFFQYNSVNEYVPFDYKKHGIDFLIKNLKNKFVNESFSKSFNPIFTKLKMEQRQNNINKILKEI